MTERKRHFRKKPRPPPPPQLGETSRAAALFAPRAALVPPAPRPPAPQPPRPAAAASRPPPPRPPSAPEALKSGSGGAGGGGAGGSGGGVSGGFISDAALFAAAAALAARVGSGGGDGDGDAAPGGTGRAVRSDSLLASGSAGGARGSASALAPLPLPTATFTLKDEPAAGGGGEGGRRAAFADSAAEVKQKRQYNRMSLPVEAFDLLQPLAERLSEILGSASPDPMPQYVYRRELSSSTYLNRVHVVAEMAREILPDIPENEEVFGSGGADGSPAAAAAAAAQRKKHRGPTCREPNGTLFRTKIRFLDAEGREWPITYERLRSAGQRHTRLSAGWHELCQANGMVVGDVVSFTRYGGRGEEGVVLVEKEEERR